ncbi:MAG: hypothetical protein ABIQ00_27875 [Chitinophagaceae bacterium]
MKTKTESTPLRFARSLATGVLLSILILYSIHVFGTWTVENFQPGPESMSTVLLHNKCVFFGKTHTLRPNTDISGLGEGIDGTKLSGSFMNFSDGHILAAIILAVLLGTIIFSIRNIKRANNH